MTPQDLAPVIDDLRRALATHLGIKGATLERQVRRAGRLLPRRLRAEAAFLLQAEQAVQNAKLARTISADRVADAHRAIETYLSAIDPKDRARTRLLNIAAVVAFNLLLLAGLVIAVLVWRGVG